MSSGEYLLVERREQELERVKICLCSQLKPYRVICQAVNESEVRSENLKVTPPGPT
jgi:hypothetical protein